MKLTGDILEVLGSAHPDGNLLYLDGQLAAALYQRVDALLQTAGGRWSKTAKAHVFPGPACDAVMTLTAAGEVTTAREAKAAAGWFATPPPVAERLLELAGLQPQMTALEPSAGEGAIARPLAARVAAVDCVEIDAGRAAILRRGGYARQVTCAGFLALRPGYGGLAWGYDRVVMNPPFARGTDVAHAVHALRFLRPGGRLVSVLPAGVTTRTGQAAARLRARIEQSGWMTALPPGSFAGSGASIDTVIAVIHVPGGAATGGPVRVTFDRTAAGVPLFNPAAAAPGVYVRRDSWAGHDRVFRFTGKCAGCGAPTWRHDDGDDDVRGPFGDCTGVPVGGEELRNTARPDLEVPEGISFSRCAACWNDARRSARAIEHARAQLAAKPPADGQLELFDAAW